MRTMRVRLCVMVPAFMLAAAVMAGAQDRADALKNLTAERSASPELVGQMAKELNITPGQAEGAAGALLGFAKKKLTADEFGEVAKAIPGVDGLLKAAPAAGDGGRDGKLAGIASLAGSFKSLGLEPGMVTKVVPVLTKFVGGKGGANAAKLLAKVLM